MTTLAQLRAFVLVARHRHFTRAAETLGVAQPSVSYQVRALERELKVRLVELVDRRVYLTEAGERLAQRAELLVNELDDLEQEMRAFSGGRLGRLRIGATRTIGGYVLPGLLADFSARHPQIELRVTIDNTRAIEQLLLERRLDLAAVEWRVTSPELSCQPFRRDRLALVASPDHPLASCPEVSLDDLRGQRFVLREPGSGTRALAEQLLGPVLPEIEVAIELNEPEAIVRAVEAGLGLTIISEVIVARQVSTGTLVVLTMIDVDPGREFSLVALRERPFSPAMRAFRSFLIDRSAAAG